MLDSACNNFKSHYSHHWHDGAFRCIGVPFQDYPQLTVRYDSEPDKMCYQILRQGIEIESHAGFSFTVARLVGLGMPHSDAVERTTRAFEDGYSVRS